MFPKNEDVVVEYVESLDGGGHQRARAWKAPPNTFADGYNIDISEVGVWKRRRGVRSQGASRGQPGGMTWVRDSINTTLLWTINGSQIFRTVGTADLDTEVNAVTNVTLYSRTLHMLVEGTYNNAAFLVNQNKAIYGCQCIPSTQATEASRLFMFRSNQVTAVPHATQHVSFAPLVIAWYQSRLWKANDQISGDGSDLAWSELDDGLTFSPANEVSIEPGIGGRITGLWPVRSLAPQLVVFKEHAIHRFKPRWGNSSAFIPGAGDELDTLTSSVEPISTTVGCVATRSIAATPGFAGGDLIYLARDGVRALARAEDDSLVGTSARLTEAIPDWIDRINWAAIDRAVATVHDNAYHLAVPMDGAEDNTHVLRMELESGAWSLHNWKVRDMAQIPTGGEDRLYMQYNTAYTEESVATGLPHVGVYHLYRAFERDRDPGFTTITYELQTRAMVFGTARQEKAFDRALFVGTTDTNETHRMRVSYSVDFGEWTTMASLFILSAPNSGVKLTQRRFSLRDIPSGTMIRFRLTHGGTDTAQPQIYYMDVSATPLQEIYDNSR